MFQKKHHRISTRTLRSQTDVEFWTTLTENDIVNVTPPTETNGDMRRARILHVRQNGFAVIYDNLEKDFVEIERIRQRVMLPW